MRPLIDPYEKYRSWVILGRKVRYSRKSKNSRMGRFGGGWNWNIGVQVGGGTIIVNLLVASLRIDRQRAAK